MEIITRDFVARLSDAAFFSNLKIWAKWLWI